MVSVTHGVVVLGFPPPFLLLLCVLSIMSAFVRDHVRVLATMSGFGNVWL